MGEVVEMYLVSDEMMSSAASTRKRTRITLNHLLKITGEKLPAHRLTRTHADQTVAVWRGRGVTEVSVNSYKFTLRSFGVWLYESRLNKTDPFKHLKTVKAVSDPAKRKPLTQAQVTKILKLAAAFHIRDHANVMVALTTALRESELCGLTWENIDFDRRVIVAWRSKTRDYHPVPMSDQLHEFLAAWKGTYERMYGPVEPTWYLLPALAGNRKFGADQRFYMMPEKRQTNMRVRMKKYYAMAGVTDLNGKGSHVTRRTAANMLMSAGGDLRDVMHLLGHSSEANTAKYLDIDTGREKLAAKMRDWKI